MKNKQPIIPSPHQVRAIRAYMNVSQRTFAWLCSISRSALADYEQSVRHTSTETLKAIAAHVGTIEQVRFKADGSIKLPHSPIIE